MWCFERAGFMSFVSVTSFIYGVGLAQCLSVITLFLDCAVRFIKSPGVEWMSGVIGTFT